jgi:hypothetical protein
MLDGGSQQFTVSYPAGKDFRGDLMSVPQSRALRLGKLKVSLFLTALTLGKSVMHCL